MKKQIIALFSTLLILLIFSQIISSSGSGFKTISDDEKKRSCIEADVCHDISDYRRTTQGDAFPYEHCICHGEIPDYGTVIEVKGPRTLRPGQQVTYTLIIHGGSGVSYGFGANATAGILDKQFQFSPQQENEFEIKYTAPVEEGEVFITFVGLSADGDLEVKPQSNETAGDTWNLNKIKVDVKEKQDDNDAGYSQQLIIIFALFVVVIIVIVLIKQTRRKSK